MAEGVCPLRSDVTVQGSDIIPASLISGSGVRQHSCYTGGARHRDFSEWSVVWDRGIRRVARRKFRDHIPDTDEEEIRRRNPTTVAVTTVTAAVTTVTADGRPGDNCTGHLARESRSGGKTPDFASTPRRRVGVDSHAVGNFFKPKFIKSRRTKMVTNTAITVTQHTLK